MTCNMNQMDHVHSHEHMQYTLVRSQFLKLIFIDYKYGRIWYQCKGNDMRIIITLIPNLK